MPADLEQSQMVFLDEQEQDSLNNIAKETQDPLSKIIPPQNQHPLSGAEQFSLRPEVQREVKVEQPTKAEPLQDALDQAIYYTQGEKAPRTADAGKFAKMKERQALNKGQTIKEN